MFLPKTKYSEPKYTRGGKFFLKDGTSYTGWYFTTFKNESFTGKTPSDTSKLLEEHKDGDLLVDDLSFYNDLIIPTEKDYTEGKFLRYFIQDKRNKVIIELKKEKYGKLIKEPFTVGTIVEWDLTTPSENITKNGYIYFGSASKNKETILLAEKTIVGLSSAIKSYSEFVK